MKLLFITPGSGDNFYCENCMRDRALVQALARCGADVAFMPLYLPVELPDPDSLIQQSPIFFGGINVWLEQKVPLYKYLPNWLTRIFDSRAMLKMAAKQAGMTDPSTLGDMTLSMLQGSSGHQKKQLDQLIDWLIIPDNTPDVVCISNALLSGIAPEIHRRLKLPVVCFLQDEDGFLDSLGKYAELCWQITRENSAYISKYIAVSEFYAQLMAQKLALEPEHITACYSGVDFADYESVKRKTDGPPTIGYLSRICQGKGFDRLVSAFITLKKQARFADLRLMVSGGSIGDDKFIAQQKNIISEAGFGDSVTFIDHFVDLKERISFFESIDLLCVPERQPVAHGRYFIEAMAANIPAIVPNTGVFNELAAKVCPELTFNNNDDTDLVEKLNWFLSGNSRNLPLREKAITHFDITNNAKAILAAIC